MPDKSSADEWIRFAQMDLNSAEYLKTMIPAPLEIICYHCQQSAEKALKAFLCFHGTEIIKTHDLRFLCNECRKINAEFSSIEENCSRATIYGVQSRYPFAMEIEESDMVLAISDAHKIIDFVENIMSNTTGTKE
ncbi:MAG: HEPN domain-containing protein [Treponema sp.]|nr:HEPN domain-containing protein [Treponema sp.]